jgi:hypothetical protein
LKSAISALENADTMEERIGRIRQIETDFFALDLKNPCKSAQSAQSVLPLYLQTIAIKI